MLLLARTEAVALLDVDFVPSASLAAGLEGRHPGGLTHAWLAGELAASRAVVLPAFQVGGWGGAGQGGGGKVG